MLRGLWLGVALLVVGCGDGEDDTKTESPAPVCEAGRVVDCPCTDGKNGTQACVDDGSKWGNCDCPMPDPATSDPKVACKLPNDGPPSDCPGPKSAVWGTCKTDIVESGVCIVAQSGRFCCPPSED